MSDAGEPAHLSQGGAAATGPAVREPGAAPRRFRVPELAALVVFFLGEFLFFSIRRGDFFLTWDNWINIFIAIAIIGILAAPATLLLVAGQFDLSVGSGLAFVGVILALTAEHHSTPLAVALAVLGGIGIGVVNGFLVTVVGVNALITTLGMLAALSGFARVMSDGQTIILNGFGSLGTERIFLRIPLFVVIFLGVVALFWFIMRYTVYGRSMYAIGANPVAARLAGIRSRRLIFLGFVLSGCAIALGGLINTSQLSAATPLAGSGYELSVVTAVILGGASLAGGRGTILGTLLGLLIVGTLNNGLQLMNVDAYWQDVARGALLIGAVSFDQLRIRLTRD